MKSVFLQAKRDIYFEEFLRLFREVDIWISIPNKETQPKLTIEDIELGNVPPMEEGNYLIDRLTDLMSNMNKLDKFLVDNPTETIQILNIGTKRAYLTFMRVESMQSPNTIEHVIKKLLRFIVVEISQMYGVCTDEVKGLFTDREIQEIRNEEIVERTRKVVKQLWNLPTRYELVYQLGIVDMLTRGMLLKKKEQNLLLSQIMGVNEVTARKLIDGKYSGKTQPTEEFELNELKQLIEQIKPKGA